jgi:hypothetical protein
MSSAALLDLLRVPATTGTARRLAKIMRSIGFIPIKSRRLMPGGFRDTVTRGWARPIRDYSLTDSPTSKVRLGRVAAEQGRAAVSASLVRPGTSLFDCDRDDGGRIIKWQNVPHGLSHKYKRVWVDIQKFEGTYQSEYGFYVGPHGLDGIAGKYEGVERFMASGDPVSLITVCMRDIDGRRFVSIYDGRHRFAWMRDHGALALPVAAPIGEASEIQKLVGSKVRICRVTG